MKKVQVNQEKCIGCGACVAMTKDSGVFDFNDDGLSYVKKNEVNEDVMMAAEACPTYAIEIIDDETECTKEDCECSECECEHDDCCCEHNHCEIDDEEMAA